MQGNSFQRIEIVNTKFDMNLLEKVRHLIEEENYSTLAKLGKCALMLIKSQLFEDVIATRRTTLVLKLRLMSESLLPGTFQNPGTFTILS